MILHPSTGAAQEECGPSPHVIRLGGAVCSAPIPEEDTTISWIVGVVTGVV